MFISVASERSTDQKPTQIGLSIARCQSDLEDAFRLVYRSYVRAGLQVPNDIGMRMVRHHFLPTTEVLVAKLGRDVISTASLIVDSEIGLPAESMYRDEVEKLRDRGLRLGEVACLADRRESPARFIEIFRMLATLLAQAAVVRGCDALIAATHPRHARFYMRQLGFKRIGEIRECPYVRGNPAVPLLFDFEERKGTKVYDFLFSLKYTDAELATYSWEDSTYSYFSSIFDQLDGKKEDSTKETVQPSAPVPPLAMPAINTQNTPHLR